MERSSEDLYARFLIPNCFIIVFTAGLLGIGVWMNAEHDVQAVLYVFGTNPNGNILLAATGIFIATGILGLLGCVGGLMGVRMEKPFLLTLYIIDMIVCLILLIICGFMLVGFRESIYSETLPYMQEAVENDYLWDNKVGEQWNRIQIRHRCCGADSAMDYRCSNWWFSESENAGYTCENYYPAPKQVPDSCCVLELNQDRDPEHVPVQNPLPKNEKRCNEDVAGNMWAGSSNVHGRGCFSALQDKVFLYIYILMGMSFCIGAFMICGVIFGIKYRRAVRNLTGEK